MNDGNKNYFDNSADRETMIQIFESLKDDDKIKENSENIPKSIDEVSRKWKLNDQVVDLFSNSINKDIKLKEKYALVLVLMLGMQLIALDGVFIASGRGFLNFSDLSFNIFITGTLGEIFCLVVVIVKYLFKDNLSESLKIILKSTNFRQPTVKNDDDKNNKNR